MKRSAGFLPVRRGSRPRLALAGLGALLAAAGATPQPARAQTVWDGTASDDWFTGGNWQGGAAPTATDPVSIDFVSPNPAAIAAPGAEAQIVVIGDGGTGALTIGKGGALEVDGGTGSVVIASQAGSTGTLNIGAASTDAADAVAPGSLDAAGITFGAGTGTLNFNHTGSSYTFAPSITGGGSVRVFSGTTTLTGTNDYTGATVISGGTLVAGQDFALSSASDFTVGAGGTLAIGDGVWADIGSLSGAGAVTLGDLSELAVVGPDSTTFSGAITGNGDFGFESSGTLTLTGTSSIGGALFICSCGTGTLAIDGGSFAAGTDTTIENGTLAIVNGGSLTTPLLDSMDATIRIDGAGSSATTTGYTAVYGWFGAGALEIANGGVLDSQGGAEIDADTFGGGGTMAATVTGAGSRWNVDGTLLIGQASFGGTATLTVADGGTVSATTEAIVGAGSTLNLGSGGLAGAFETPSLVNDGAIIADFTDSATLAADISGSGSLTKTGAGTLFLTGTNSYTGGTLVSGGTLVVNGTIGDTTIVDAGGTLGGTGTLGELGVMGRVAPGNSIGTLHTGPVTFDTGSVLAVEIAPDGRADLLDVTGAATFNGGAVEVAPEAGDYVDGRRFTIVTTTGGFTGTFDSVGYAAGRSMIFFDPVLLYEGNDVVLRLDRNASTFAGNVNASDLAGTGAALDALENAPTADGGDLLQTLYSLDSGQYQEAARQLSGSGLAGAAQMANTTSVSALAVIPRSGPGGATGGIASLAQFAMAGDTATDALDDAEVAAARADGFGSRFSPLWFDAFGGFGTRDGSGSAQGQSRRYGGVAGGVRAYASADLELGVTVSASAGRTETDDRRSHVDTRSVLVAGHARWSRGPWWFGAALGVARHGFDSSRRVDFGTFDATATGDHAGYEAVGDLSVRYEWQVGEVTVAPIAGLAASFLYEEAWEESGAGGADLSVDEADTASVQPRAGIGAATERDLGDGRTLMLAGQVLWIGRLGDSSTDYTARFVGATSSWTVPGLEEPDHAAAIGLSAGLATVAGWTVTAGYAGRFADGAQDHAILVGLRHGM